MATTMSDIFCGAERERRSFNPRLEKRMTMKPITFQRIVRPLLVIVLAASSCLGAEASAFAASGTPMATANESEARLLSSMPLDRAVDVSPASAVTLTFDALLDPASVSADTVAIVGPEGAVPATVTIEGQGASISIKPQRDFFPATRYDVLVSGAKDVNGRTLPFASLSFATAKLGGGADDGAAGTADLAARGARNAGVDDERWQPSEANRGARWRTSRPLPDEFATRRNEAMAPSSRVTSDRAVRAKALAGSVSGIVLKQNDLPLAHVKVSIDSKSAETGNDGEFALTGLPAGHHELIVDGRKVSSGKGTQFGYFVIGVDVQQDKGTPLAPIYLPKIRASDWVSLPSPIDRDTVVRTPDVPGMEIRIPKGAVLRDREGKLVTQIAIVPIPLDRSPFPFPENAPAYVSVQPAGMVVQGLTPKTSAGIRVIYPNQTDLKPGSRVSFWSYNTDSRGWQIYGEGQASDDGVQVVPDPGVALYESVGFMFTLNNPPPPLWAPPPCDMSCCQGMGSGPAPPPPGISDGGASSGSGSGTSGPNNESAGDPVDCKSGLFMLSRTDTLVRGVLPISLNRTYRPGDTVSRSFGYGAQTDYAMYLREVSNAPGGRYTQYDLILANGSSVRFLRTSPGNAYTQVIAPHYTSATSWYASVLAYENGNYVVTKKDGTKYIFSLYGTLQNILDRYGNHLDIAHNGGQITRITASSGRYLDFTYDTSSRITQIRDSGGRTWGYAYNAGGNLQTVTYPDGLIEQYTYDASGRMQTLVDRRGTTVVTNQYDANGRVQQQTLADGSIYTFAYTLDANGNVTQTNVTDPRGSVKVVTYGALGYKASVTHAAGTPLAQTISYQRDATSGLLTSTTDALGRTTTYQRDALGNITGTTWLAGTSNAVSDSYVYSTWSLPTHYTDPMGLGSTYVYDSIGNLTSSTDALGRTTTFTHNAAGQTTSVTDPLGNTQTYTNDANGDLRSASDALGHTTAFETDGYGRTVAVTDPIGRRSAMAYNVMGRVYQQTSPSGHVTTLAYDNNGNLTSVTDPNGGTTAYGYDLRDRKNQRTDAVGHAETWTYDGTNDVTSYTDRQGQVTHYTYDALGRATLITYQDGSSITPAYDAGDRLTSVVDSVSGAITRSYDGFDQLTQEQTPQGTVSYTYDADGRRTSMNAGSQLPITYTFDNANRLTQIVQGTQTVGFGYDNADRRTNLTLPNGVSTSYAYDVANELTGLTYKTSTSSTLAALSYTYDAAGRRTSRNGGFVNDSASTPTSGTNTFDLANKQTLWNGFTLSYDLNGDPTSNAGTSPATTYTFDARHRLTQILQSGTPIASFSYDTFNRRSSKTIGGVTTSFLYDGQNAVQEMQGATTNPILTGLGIDERFERTEAAGSRYFLTDALGSTIALTDGAQTVQETYGYEPYGEVTSTGSSNNPYQYTGRENDGTGLYYYRARYYSPSLKRFISEDPIGLNGGLNEYAYTSGNPVNFKDPLGRDWVSDQLKKEGKKTGIDLVCKNAYKDDECKACDCIYDAKVAFTCKPADLSCIEKLKLRCVSCKTDCGSTGKADFPPPEKGDPPDGAQ